MAIGSGPTVFFLHFLGGSAGTWSAVIAALRDDADCVAVDLPGFGGRRHATGYPVAAMAEAVAEIVRARAAPDWAIVGHSMGAKVAAALARRAEDGEPGLGGLRRIVLVAGSPPSPEPMDEVQREEMAGWFDGEDGPDRTRGDAYIRANVGEALAPALHEQAVADVTRAHPDAWRAWLREGSREDWSARIGVLGTPALLVAGERDPDLGPEAQRRLALPHYARGRLESLPGAGHLLPYERPEALAELIRAHLR